MTDPVDEIVIVEPAESSAATVATGAAFGTLVGLVMGGPLGAVLGAALAPYGDKLARRVAAEWSRRGSELISAAAADADQSVQKLVDAVADDPELTALLTRLLAHASTTNLPGKIRVLGRVFAMAVKDSAVMDDAAVFAEVLNALEAPHVRVLAHIPKEVPASWRAQPEQSDGGPVQPPTMHIGWTQEWLRQLDPGVDTLALPVLLGQLAGLGVIYDNGMGRLGVSEPYYLLTGFGLRIADLLSALT